MSDPTPCIARLGLARDQLAEARRYVRTRPDVALKMLAATPHLFRELDDHRFEVTNKVARKYRRYIVRRHWCTVDAIHEAVLIDPDAAIGGIDLVRHELGSLMSGLRREWEREARDRELMEAYGR